MGFVISVFWDCFERCAHVRFLRDSGIFVSFWYDLEEHAHVLAYGFCFCFFQKYAHVRFLSGFELSNLIHVFVFMGFGIPVFFGTVSRNMVILLV